MTALDPSARADRSSTGLTAHEWRWARERAKEGFSARSIARRLDVPHSTILRAAVRWGWDVAWGREREQGGGDLGAPEAEEQQKPVDEPAGPQIEPQVSECQREAGEREREEWRPPDDEASARLWHCRRCGLSGFNPNRRRREWHTEAICDERLARLDRGLNDSPRPLDLRRCPW